MKLRGPRVGLHVDDVDVAGKDTRSLDEGFRLWGVYLEGQGDLVSRLIAPITHIVTLLIPIITLLTKSP